MNNPMRTAVCALVLGLLTLGVFTLRFACAPGDWQEIMRHSEELQRLDQATFRREQAFRLAAQAYIAQHCTLAQTMQWWQELEQELGLEWPVHRDIVQQKLVPLSDEERHYGGILANVEAILRGQPEELATVLRRLEKDYEQFQAGRAMPSTARTKGREQKR